MDNDPQPHRPPHLVHPRFKLSELIFQERLPSKAEQEKLQAWQRETFKAAYLQTFVEDLISETPEDPRTIVVPKGSR